MIGAIEACVGMAGTAASFGLALSQLRGLRNPSESVSNRFLVGLPGPEMSRYQPQHVEYVMRSDEYKLTETGLPIVLSKDEVPSERQPHQDAR